MAFLTGAKWFCKDNSVTTPGDGTIGYSAVSKWATGATIAAGALRRPLTAPALGSERVYIATTGGTTHASTEPTWPTARGASVADNTVVWQEVTGVAAVNGDLSDTAIWTTVKNTSVSKGQIIQRNNGASLQICSTAGTAGNGSEPAFNDTAGNTTVDGTATWTSLGAPSNFASFAAPWARLNLAMAASPFASNGDTVYVAKTHAETQTSAISYALTASGVLIIGIDDTASVNPPATPSTGASVTTTGASALAIGVGTNTSLGKVKGIQFNCGTGSTAANLTINSGGGSFSTEDCEFNLVTTATTSKILHGAASSNNYHIEHTNPKFTFGNASQSVQYMPSRGFIKGGSIAATGTVPTVAFSGVNVADNGSYFQIQGMDMSAINTTLFSSGTAGTVVSAEYCKLNASVAITSAMASPYGAVIKLHNCDSGATNYRYGYFAFGGNVISETTILLSGGNGATDNTQAMTWNMTTGTVSTFDFPLISEEIAEWIDVTGSAKTATIELTTDATLTNADFWVELIYPGSSASPLGSIVTSKLAYLGTAAALSSSAATWTSGKANNYKVALTFTPQMKGAVKARLFLAKRSVSVYANPYLIIT